MRLESVDVLTLSERQKEYAMQDMHYPDDEDTHFSVTQAGSELWDLPSTGERCSRGPRACLVPGLWQLDKRRGNLALGYSVAYCVAATKRDR